jgi:uncharacterized membrane protein
MRIAVGGGRALLAALFVVAGVSHFTSRDFFVSIVPPYLPWPGALVAVSGITEIVLGVLLLMPAARRLAGWGLMALLVAVFPANIYMAVHPDLYPTISPMALMIRLPLQVVLIGLVYWLSRPTAR